VAGHATVREKNGAKRSPRRARRHEAYCWQADMMRKPVRSLVTCGFCLVASAPRVSTAR
jgi:hypothetical protein